MSEGAAIERTDSVGAYADERRESISNLRSSVGSI
jgi:hypothetical protein